MRAGLIVLDWAGIGASRMFMIFRVIAFAFAFESALLVNRYKNTVLQICDETTMLFHTVARIYVFVQLAGFKRKVVIGACK